MKHIILLFVVLYSWNSFAEPIAKGFTASEIEEMVSANAMTRSMSDQWGTLFSDVTDPLTLNLMQETAALPVGEYETAGYLLFSSDYNYQSFAAKKAMAENLPEDVTLVVFTGAKGKSKQAAVRKDFAKLLPENRLKVIYLPRANRGFWARDGVPVPVWRRNAKGESLFTVVDARYYHQFEPDKKISQIFGSKLTSHKYYYEGGNFMANSEGDCLAVNTKAVQEIPDEIFFNHYGCKRFKRLPFVKGIGHADESVKFVGDNKVLTDTFEYVEILEDMGLEVIRLPRPKNKMENYTNSLIINGTVFVPIFDQKNDEQAIEVYENLGLQVIPINTSVLSNRGLGSLHCITMTYPPVSFAQLLEAVDGQLVE